SLAPVAQFRRSCDAGRSIHRTVPTCRPADRVASLCRHGSFHVRGSPHARTPSGAELARGIFPGCEQSVVGWVEQKRFLEALFAIPINLALQDLMGIVVTRLKAHDNSTHPTVLDKPCPPFRRSRTSRSRPSPNGSRPGLGAAARRRSSGCSG